MPVTTTTIDGGPARFHAAITPSDSTDFTVPTRAIRVGGAGNVAVVMDATVVTYTCVAGEVLPVCAQRVNATGTTATGLVAWW